MDFTIRAMRKKDIEGIQQVAKKSWHATYDGIIPVNIQKRFLQSAYSDDTLKRRMKRSHMIVAEVAGKIVGFANFSYPNEGEKSLLNAIYIYPHFQGNGIGTALLQAGIDILESVRFIYLHVEKANESAIAFYKEKDFEIVAETEEQFSGHTLQTIQMKLKL